MADLILTVTVNDTDQKCLLSDLVDIDDWVQLAMVGKINNCWKRFQRDWIIKLMEDKSFTDPIPFCNTPLNTNFSSNTSVWVSENYDSGWDCHNYLTFSTTPKCMKILIIAEAV